MIDFGKKATLQRQRFVALYTLMFASVCCVGSSHAAVSLDLAAAHGLQGTVIEAGLNVVTDAELAGFNAEIILPAGVSVNSVLMGDLLAPPENYGFSFAVNGQNLRVVVYSGSNTFTGSGEILKLLLLLDAQLLGLKELAFPETNPDPLVNSQHAVSNADGSESLPHDFSNQSFLVYSESSDYDGDQMPDAWEIEFGLDPVVDNTDMDSDDDGYTDLEEYLGGSDPKDPGSTPDRLFHDGFENGVEP